PSTCLRSSSFPYTTLFRSRLQDSDGKPGPARVGGDVQGHRGTAERQPRRTAAGRISVLQPPSRSLARHRGRSRQRGGETETALQDRKSTCLNSSHEWISYA